MDFTKISFSLPTWLVEILDERSERLGVPRQSVIRMLLADALGVAEPKQDLPLKPKAEVEIDESGLCPLKIQAVYEHLEKLARKGQARGLTTYAPVGAVVNLDAYSYELWRILGAVSARSARDKGVLLTAIVVNANKGTPGDDFYPLLPLVTQPTGDKLKDWSDECARVFKAYEP